MDLPARIAYAACTLYMMLILLRWFGTYLSLELDYGRMAWLPRLTDPLIKRIRGVLPPMGPVDFGPIAALVLVWMVRTIAVGVLR